jgi:hypothetical protein
MKAKSRNLLRVIVSLVFIALGLLSAIPGVLGMVKALPAIHLYTVLAVAFDVVMFLAGMLGLMKMKKSVCVVLSIIIFVGFSVSAVSAILANAGVFDVAFTIAKAIVAWFYIGCVDKSRR